MTWVDGSVYEGEWISGIQHGYGRMLFPNGITKEGYFENNCYKIQLDVLDDQGELKRSNLYDDQGLDETDCIKLQEAGFYESEFARIDDEQEGEGQIGSHLQSVH